MDQNSKSNEAKNSSNVTTELQPTRDLSAAPSITDQLQELLRREAALQEAEDARDIARTHVTDLLERRCLAVAAKLGINSGRNFKDVAVVPLEADWKISWSEYFRYEHYDRIQITIPAAFIDLDDDQFLAQLETIAPQCTATSDVTETIAHRKAEQEEKDKREYERLQKKYQTSEQKGTSPQR